jgi:hypothetical protein
MVKAIFAYKIFENYWKPKDDYFWTVARLSVEYASKFYRTCLYADTKTQKILSANGLEFDEFVDSTELFKTVTEHSYGMTKVLTMIEQTEPYIILDLDTVIFSAVNSTSHICYGHKEINLEAIKPVGDKIPDLYYLEEYYKRPYERFKLKYDLQLRDINWNYFPSNSLILVNSPFLVSQIYTEILELMSEDIFMVPPPYTVQFYEQFLFYNFFNHLKLEVDFIYQVPPGGTYDDFVNLLDLYQFKYLHLDTYDRSASTKKVIDLLKKTLDKVGSNEDISYI